MRGVHLWDQKQKYKYSEKFSLEEFCTILDVPQYTGVIVGGAVGLTDYIRFRDAVVTVATKFCDVHNLDVTLQMSGTRFRLTPQTGAWMAVVTAIRETGNGAKIFHFDDNFDFLQSGPWTPRQGALLNLHVMKHHADLYGYQSPKAMVNKILNC